MQVDSGPSFRLEGFSLRPVCRQFPDLTDYWDGNWLIVACECNAPGSCVRSQGPFVHLSGIADLVAKLEALHSLQSKTAIIDFIEPQLRMQFEADSQGHVHFQVWLTPEHLVQTHRFSYHVDLSYLPDAIRQCKAILAAYPIRGIAAE